MGKNFQLLSEKDVDTKVLFKRSHHTAQTYSTFSGISQHTKSAAGHLKRKISKQKGFYVDGDKIKRDLSIETDICVLRRYCLRKRNRLSNREGSSAKSRYSYLTEVDDGIAKSQVSACGDKPKSASKTAYQTEADVTNRMIENFKNLLLNWLQDNLKEDRNAKKRTKRTFRSIIRSIDSQPLEKPSVPVCSNQIKHKATDVSINDKPNHSETSSGINLLSKCTWFSIPIVYKNFQIISSLSVPRNIHKQIRHKRQDRKITSKIKIQRPSNHSRKNKILLALKEPNSLIGNKSSERLVTISTTCSPPERSIHMFNNKNVDEHKCSALSTQTFQECASAATSLPEGDMDLVTNHRQSLWRDKPLNEKNIVVMPNLIHRFLGNLKISDFIVKDGNSRVDISTSTSTSLMQQIKIDRYVSNIQFNCNSDHLSRLTKSTREICKIPSNASKQTCAPRDNKNEKKVRRVCKKRKIVQTRKHKKLITTPIPDFDNISHKNFTLLYKKINKKVYGDYNIFKYFKDIFAYYSEFQDSNNILKLDLRINVSPVIRTSERDNIVNDLISQEVRINYKGSPGDMSTKESASCGFDNPAGIIPILDGAASHAKYIYTQESSIKVKKKCTYMERSTTTLDLQISEEIGELKSAVKELAVIAENLIYEHLGSKKKHKRSNETTSNPKCPVKFVSTQYSEQKKHSNKIVKNSSNFKNSSKAQYWNKSNEDQKELYKLSKGIQFSSGFVRNQKIHHGFKVPKDETNNHWESEVKLTVKNTSYRIIDSESVIKVTDMTCASDENKGNHVDQSLTCSLPKSRSLFEMSNDKGKHRIIAYYCEGGVHKTRDDFIYTPLISGIDSTQHPQSKSFVSVSPCQNTSHVKPNTCAHTDSKFTSPVTPCPHGENFVCSACRPEMFKSLPNCTGATSHTPQSQSQCQPQESCLKKCYNDDVPCRHKKCCKDERPCPPSPCKVDYCPHEDTPCPHKTTCKDPPHQVPCTHRVIRENKCCHKSSEKCSQHSQNSPHKCPKQPDPCHHGRKQYKQRHSSRYCKGSDVDSRNSLSRSKCSQCSKMNEQETLNVNLNSSCQFKSNRFHCLDESQCSEITDQPIRVVKRRFMSSTEGCMYCTLMWIPIFIIILILYHFLSQSSSPSRRVVSTVNNTVRHVRQDLNLSDLGF